MQDRLVMTIPKRKTAAPTDTTMTGLWYMSHLLLDALVQTDSLRELMQSVLAVLLVSSSLDWGDFSLPSGLLGGISMVTGSEEET